MQSTFWFCVTQGPTKLWNICSVSLYSLGTLRRDRSTYHVYIHLGIRKWIFGITFVPTVYHFDFWKLIFGRDDSDWSERNKCQINHSIRWRPPQNHQKTALATTSLVATVWPVRLSKLRQEVLDVANKLPGVWFRLPSITWNSEVGKHQKQEEWHLGSYREIRIKYSAIRWRIVLGN